MDLLIQNGVLYQYHGEYVDGKPIIPDGVEDIYPSALGYGNNAAYIVYKEGKYLGTANNPYKYFTGITHQFYISAGRGGDPLELHPDTEYICTEALCDYKPGKHALKLPSSIKAIGTGAFRRAYLAQLIIPEGCKTIAEDAFKDHMIQKIVLPDSVEKIGKGAFPKWGRGAGYRYLQASPKVLSLVGKDALIDRFRNYLDTCQRTTEHDQIWLEEVLKIKTAFVSGAIKDEHLGSLSFALANKLTKPSDAEKILAIAEKRNDTELKAAALEISKKVSPRSKEAAAKRQEEKALGLRKLSAADLKKIWTYRTDEDGNITLTKYIGTELIPTIPDTIGKAKVTRIGVGAFLGNQEIESVYLPEGLVAIGRNAFANCKKLQTVEVPSTVTVVGEGSFSGCDSLMQKPTEDKLLSAEKKVQMDYCDLENIREQWKFVIDSKRNICVLEKYTGNETKIQVPSSILGYPVAEIGKFCFSTGIHAHSGGRHGTGPQQKHNKKIVEVLIPNSVKYIADYAFSGCKKLETVKVPYNCRVDDTAFYGCD